MGGLVRTEPAMTSGWHHHGDYATSIYAANGTQESHLIVVRAGHGAPTINVDGPAPSD